MDRGAEKDFAGFDFESSGNARNGGASGSGISDETEHDLRASFVGNEVGSAAAGNCSDVEGGWPEHGICRQGEGADFLQGVEQRMNCRMAQLWISGMGEFSARD